MTCLSGRAHRRLKLPGLRRRRSGRFKAMMIFDGSLDARLPFSSCRRAFAAASGKPHAAAQEREEDHPFQFSGADLHSDSLRKGW
jgi:hypothetical protein